MPNFTKYAFVSGTSAYKIQHFGSYQNVYSKYCIGKGINFSGHHSGLRCKECYSTITGTGVQVKQHIMNRGKKIKNVESILLSIEMNNEQRE